MKKFLLIIPIIFLFCGCDDYNELNDIAITTGMAIDKYEDKYKVSILISNSQKADESNKEGISGTTVYDGIGKSLSQALKEIDSKIPKQLYFGHLAVVVISNDIAKDGLDNMADYLFRNPENNERFYLVMTKDGKEAADVLKVLSPLEEFPSQNIKLNIENADRSTAISIDMTFDNFMKRYLERGIEPYLPTIEITGSIKKASSSTALESTEPKAVVKLKSVALFKESKFIDYTTDDESRGINLINSSINEMIISNKCKNDNIVTALSNVRTEKKVKFKNGKPKYIVTIKAQGDIQEVNCNINLNDKKVINKINKKVENKVKYLVNNGIKKAQENETDIFGFGNLLYKKNPKYFNNINDWNKEFSNIDIEVEVNIVLKTIGSIKQSIKGAKTNEKY